MASRTGNSGARRPGRPTADRPVLTRAAILADALELVDAEGMAALSMRKLAARLGVDPMSIYHHVPSKRALVAGLVELVFAGTALPASTDDAWQARVRAWARAYLDIARAHPNLVLQIVTDAAAASDAAIRVSEPLYAALDSAGLTPREVVQAAGTLVDFVHGFALGLAGPPDAEGDAAVSMAGVLAALPGDAAPVMRRVHEALAAAPDHGPAYFDAGVDIVIRGAVPEPDRSARPPRA